MSRSRFAARAAPPLSELTGHLRERSRKITDPRQAILDLLRQQTHPLSCKDIFAALPSGQCNLATVYRSLHLLRRMDIVQRFDFGDRVARFELSRDGANGHHHHLICTRCDGVMEIDDCFPAEWEQRLAQRSGFRAVTHRLEFFGICPACQ